MANQIPLIVNAGAGQIQQLATGDNLSVAGNIVTGNVLTDGYYYANGAPFGGGGNANTGNITFDNTDISTNLANADITITGNGTGAINIVTGANGYTQLQNDSDANGSSYVWLEDGNVYIESNGGEWTFDSTGNLSSTGNIIGSYLYGDGSNITNLPADNYGNANVAEYLPTFTGNLTANNISLTGNLVGRYSNGNSSVNIAQDGNITLGIGSFNTTYLTVSQYGIDVFGNIVGNYLYGDGSNITNLPNTNLIVNGNSYANISTTDGNLDININSNQWIFDTDGNTSLPGNVNAAGNVNANIFVLNNAGNSTYSVIQQNQNPPYGGEAYGIELLTTTDDANVFSSVSSGPDYVTLQSTNAGNANVIVQGGYGVTISTSNATGADINEWSFVASGDTFFPGALSTAGNILSQGEVSATGNIITAGYFIGNFAGNVTGNFVVPGANTQVLFNTNGNADATAGMTFVKGPNLFTVLGNVSATNFTGGNLSNGATKISVANNGNVSIGVGLFNTTVLNVNTSTGISVLGNIVASGYISATGNILSNANVITLAASGANGAAINGAGLVAGANIASIIYDNSVFGWTVNEGWHPSSNVAYNLGRSNRYWNNLYAVNVNGINQAMSGYISAVGNVYGGNIIGNGIISTTGNIYATDINLTGNVYGSNGNLILSANIAQPQLGWLISNDNPAYAGANNSALVTPLSDDIHIGEILFQATTGTAITTFAGPNNGPFSNAFNVISTANILLTAQDVGNANSYSWTLDTTGGLTTPAIVSTPGVGEAAYFRGTRKVVGGLGVAAPYSTSLTSSVPTLAYISTPGSQSAKVTFAVESAGSAFCWEQFDVVAVPSQDVSGAVNYVVSNRVKSTAGVPDTVVSASMNGAQIEIMLTLDASQTSGTSSFDAVEFGLMVD